MCRNSPPAVVIRPEPACTYTMGTVAAGATPVVSLDFTVLSGTQAPPDGSLITAVVSDRAHGGFGLLQRDGENCAGGGSGIVHPAKLR